MHEDTKVFFTNFFYLSFLKGISNVLPLITIPFLIHAIGIEKFGTLEFAKAISFYFTTFVSYGFRYSATKQIALHQQDKPTIGQIVSSVYTIKLVIIVICLIVMSLLIIFIPRIREERVYVVSFFPVVIASSLFPTFAFQGLKKMYWLTLLNVIFKVIFLAALFIFIREPADAVLVPILLAVVDIFRLGMALFILYIKLEIPMRWPVWSIILQQIREGLHIFLSKLAIMVYSRFSTVFLGFFEGSTAVSIYTIGDRIIRTTEGMLDPFMQALYPIVYQKISTHFEVGIKYIKHFAKISVIIVGGIGMGYWLFADKIILFLTGSHLASSHLQEAVVIFKLHAFLPAVILLSNLVGIGILMPLQAGKKYTLVMVLTGLLAIGLHFMLVPLFQIRGAAWANLCSEVFAVTFLLLITSQKINALKNREKLNLLE